MLGSIFGSASRVKILNLLMLSTDKKVQAASLAKDLDLPVNSNTAKKLWIFFCTIF